MSYYPPGVTGAEPQITGEWSCVECGALLPDEWEDEPFWGLECPDGCEEPDEEREE